MAAPANSAQADGAGPPGRPWAHLATLFGLYLVQGLPFGFQVGALPVFLREAGVSLTTIGLAGALSLPWTFKILWAPLVDRGGGRHAHRWGRRRAWILPLQLALAITCAAAAFFEPAPGAPLTALLPLLALVLAMNLFAATMDIAVDGLAVDVLAARDLGYGNIAQVVGYKAGMLIGGGLLLVAAARLGWTGMFAIMAAITVAGAILAAFMREPTASPTAQAHTLRQVLTRLARALRTPGIHWLLLFIATYKLGESMADTLFKPFLVDHGFDKQQIGLWVGTYGMVASLAGSAAGGILASRTDLLRAVALTAAMRVIPVAGELWLSLIDPTAAGVIAVTVSEHFFGGALTTAMFAYMMAQVDRDIGATHYTLFATIEVFGKQAAGWTAGVLADVFGYPPVFAGAVLLSALFLALLAPIARLRPGPGRATAPAPPPP
ncbi:MFS transporter [Haliangium sp.]|uniref:MFS transporter n=1 Tax=Haliangium sp. TaxID=2663208 RepID=UPI003D13C266